MINIKQNKAKKKLIDFSYVIASNFIDLFIGLLISIIVPIFISIEEFALLRTFSLYIAYISILNFGFNDGIYIKYGNFDFENLPFNLFKKYTLHLMTVEFILGIGLLTLAHIEVFNESKLMILFLALNVFIVNVNSYMNFINQFTRRFKINLMNNFISKLFQMILICICLLNKVDDAYTYMLIITIANAINMISNLIINRRILLSKSLSNMLVKTDIISFYKSGFPIMIGYQASLLIFALGQFTVKYSFSPIVFAYFAFSFSIMNLINIFINAVSMWIFPYLKRVDPKKIEEVLLNIELLLIMIIGLALSSSFLIEIIIKEFLEKYVASIPYIKILFPIILINGLIKVIEVNAFKIYNKEKAYMKVNIMIFIFSVVIFYIGAVISISTNFIAIIAVIIMIIYLCAMCYFLREQIKLKSQLKNLVYAFMIIIFYYIISLSMPPFSGFFIYLLFTLSLILVILIIHKNRGNLLWKL